MGLHLPKRVESGEIGSGHHDPLGAIFMLIKNRLHISTLFSVLTVFLIVFAIFVASHKINEAHEYEKKANEIVQDVFHLTILTNDYLLYSTKRSQIQRQLKYNSLSKLLSKLESQEPEKKNQIS